MKIHISRQVRLGLTIFLGGLIIGLSFILYKLATEREYENKEVSLYDYHQKADVSYRVYYKPNPIYSNTESQGLDTYISAYVESFQAFFEYSFQGQGRADIAGDYEIVGMVEGYNSVEGKKITIWSKEFLLAPRTAFKGKENKIYLKEIVPIRIQEFNSFASDILSSSKVNSQVKLTVTMNVNLKAKTDQGIIKEKNSPTLTIPLNTPYFSVAISQNIDSAGSIKTTEKVMLPLNKKSLVIYGVAVLIVVGAMLGLMFFTTSGEINSRTKALNKIFKVHGDRLITVESVVNFDIKTFYKVKTFEDLIRVADEIGRPIVYQSNTKDEEISKFYVFDGGRGFFWEVTESVELCEITQQKNEGMDVNL